MKVPTNISTLVGVGSSICGGSAIAATAPVIGADDEEIAQSISVIFLFNVAAALLFPTFGGILGLSNEGFGLFAGTAVNDTSSVTAAAAAWDGMHTGSAHPGHRHHRQADPHPGHHPHYLGCWPCSGWYGPGGTAGSGRAASSISKIFPFFILFFVLASILTTLCLGAGVSSGVFTPFKELSKFFIIMAMAAIGLNTDIVKLVKTGGKPILMGVCCWAAITAVSLGMQHVLGIW